MKINVITRKIELKDKTRDYIEKKLTKLDKFFSSETEARVVVGTVKNNDYIEVNLYANGMVYRAEVSDPEICAATDKAVDVIERQIRRNKTRLAKKIKVDAPWNDAMISGKEYEGGEEKDEFEIVKVKKFSIKPMTTEEAILQMNLLGHNFFVYKNAETDEPNVVYKRRDGKYALIETQE